MRNEEREDEDVKRNKQEEERTVLVGRFVVAGRLAGWLAGNLVWYGDGECGGGGGAVVLVAQAALDAHRPPSRATNTHTHTHLHNWFHQKFLFNKLRRRC